MDKIEFKKYLNKKDQTLQSMKKIEEMMIDMSEKEIIEHIKIKGKDSKVSFLKNYDGKIIKQIEIFEHEK
jgi:hypothetical protein